MKDKFVSSLINLIKVKSIITLLTFSAFLFYLLTKK